MEIDISSKLNKISQKIKFAEGMEYEVITDAETFLIVQEKLKNKGTELSINDMYEIIENLMGTDALNAVKSLKPTVNGLTSIIIAIMAIINEVTYEEMEKRFREQL